MTKKSTPAQSFCASEVGKCVRNLAHNLHALAYGRYEAMRFLTRTTHVSSITYTPSPFLARHLNFARALRFPVPDPPGFGLSWVVVGVGESTNEIKRESTTKMKKKHSKATKKTGRRTKECSHSLPCQSP
eukprot:5897331-Amphidinium_carterae.1